MKGPALWLAGALLLLPPVLTWWWSIRAVSAARRSNHSSARSLARRAIVSWVASLVAGVLGTVLGVMAAFHSVEGGAIDPAQKARVLAEGISQAMNATTFLVMLTFLPGVAAVVVLLRARDAAKRSGESAVK